MNRAVVRRDILFRIVATALYCQTRALSLPVAFGAYSVMQSSPSAISIPAENYILGPGDQLTFSIADIDELNNKSFRVDMRGDLDLPLVGSVHAANRTVTQIKQQIAECLGRFLKNPDVVVSISDYHSQPISVLGAVNAPGVHQLEGQKTLFEVLSLAGGLRPDAGSIVHITRDLRWGRIPLPDAKEDVTERFSVASIKVKAIMTAADPAANIIMQPNDIISVPKGELVYAVGSVTKAGGFVLGENEMVSTLQVISLAEGLQKTAAPDKARILRALPGSTIRTEIPVNVKRIMAGKASDVAMKPDDILFVPNSAAKSATYRSLDAIVQTAIGMAVYGRY